MSGVGTVHGDGASTAAAPTPTGAATTTPAAAARPRVPWWAVALAALGVGVPLIVAAVVLHGRPWHPVLDLAMTELRVRDVFGPHTPLIGLPGRIGTYPDQGSHPGPLSFVLLAPTYRLLGSSPWALEAGTVVIHLVVIAAGLALAVRRLGWVGLAGGSALFALALRGYGQDTLTQPWNPYLPVLAWLLVLLAAWSVLDGDAPALVPLVAAASFCAQTHVPYLTLGAAMVALAAVATGWYAWRCGGDRGERRHWVRWGLGALVMGIVLWSPPVVDQLRRTPGNFRTLLDHFGSPPEDPIGLADGITIVLRHLDVTALVRIDPAGTGQFVADAAPWAGAIVLATWIVAAVASVRIGSRSLRSLHVVVGVALLVGMASAARIFGRPWYYLTLWAWGTTLVLLGAVAWTALAWWVSRRAATDVRRPVTVVAAAVAALATLGSTVAFADAHVPERRLSDAVGVLAGPTYEAIVAGAGAAEGPDGTYLVRWSDAADIGSPGFGLLAELERRGLDVITDDYFRVQATGHRTGTPGDAVAQIQLATGAYVDRWRDVPGAVEVASYDHRTPEQLAEFAAARRRLVDRLAAEGLGELVPLVDWNLFGISTDVRLSAADHADLSTLVAIGQPMAVFVAPPAADDDG